MCGRAAVIRGGAALAMVAGARRVIHDRRSRPAAGGGGGAPAGDRGAGGAGFFRDGGGAHGVAHRYADAAAPASAAAAQGASHAKSAAPMPGEFEKAAAAAPSSDDTATQLAQGDSQQASQTTTATATPRANYVNFNCGPTSTMPVWRIQTVEEQSELLALDKSALSQDTHVKQEMEELLGGDETTKVETLQPIPVIQYMSFGFANPLAGRKGQDGSTISDLVFNARSETVDEKPLWRGLVSKKRCVALVDGFFEFHTELSEKTGEATKKQGYFFHMPASDGKTPTITVKKDSLVGESPFPVMHLAAVYDASVDDATGEMQYRFCILTCGPSKEMRPIHNRQPVVLSPEDAKKWVDVEGHDWQSVKPLMKPYEGLGFYKVPAIVNNSRNHGVECIEPLDAYEKRTKAAGISRFFSPVAKSSKSPTPAAAAASSPKITVHASEIVGAVAGDETKQFLNTKGAPGRVFAPRVNPADTGITGDHHTATTLPSTSTSDAAVKAEEFVQHLKAEGINTDEQMKTELDRKRKHEEEKCEEGAAVKREEGGEAEAKRHKKPTAADRAHVTRQ